MGATSEAFRKLAEACGLPVGIKDGGGRYLWANAAFVEAMGLHGRFRPGVTDADLFPAATAAILASGTAATFAAGTRRQSQETLALPGGERVFLVEWVPLAAAEGAAGIGIIAVEITERSRAEEDVLASRALFKGILDIADDAIVSVDERQRIVLFNQGAERIFGYAAEEVIGQPLNLLLPPAARAAHGGHLAHFRSAPEHARQMGERGQIRGLRKSGQVFPAEASISRIGIEGRTTYTAILRDVTRQHEAEAAIKALNTDLSHRAIQLENANRELEAFSYSVSHDLRAPLRAIDGFSLVLMEDYGELLPQGARDALERVRNATQRMGQLIDDILNLSRLTRGDIHRERVDLSAIARSIVDDLSRSQPRRAVDVDIAEGLTADADPHLIQVVLANLLSNSWKYTAKHPTARIEVGATETDDHRRGYYVRDDGAGFDMAYVHKLFGAFQRLHGPGEFPGNGIGLATVQRIIHKHGGDVWARGEVEHGATVTFTLG